MASPPVSVSTPTVAGTAIKTLHLIYLTLWSVSHAAHISRMAVARFRPTAFRPGVMLQRPWNQQRLMQAASHRAPYVIYRNTQPQRYAAHQVKHYNPIPTRHVYNTPWKATARMPSVSAVTPSEYEFVRAASAHAQAQIQHTDGGTGANGAIHTIPAPNLSLSRKPIVVIESENVVGSEFKTSEAPRPTYDVTEKYSDQPIYQIPAKIEKPIGFSKATSLTSPELEALVRNGAALQLASDFGLSAIALPQHAIVSPQPIITQHSILPQQFTMQGFHAIPNPQELLHAGPEGLVISPNALYEPDPTFLQNLQNQLLQRFPGVEFVPYAADVQSQGQIQTQESQIQPQLFLLQNEQIVKQTPSSFVVSESQNQKNLYQRETQEANVATLVPETLQNVTENQIEVTSVSEPPNIPLELVTVESQPATTTIKNVVETSSEEQNTTPIYYAQIGQSVGNAIANGFYSAINDVRAAATIAQEEKQQETTIKPENITTSTTITEQTVNPELKDYFVYKPDIDEKNQTVSEIKPLLGVPFEKPADSLNVAYTLLRTDDKEAKVSKDGSIIAGQLVEASISEDTDFNKEKANLTIRRAPIRLLGVTEKRELSTTNALPKITMVKAKIPPKSKLTFDDKTGEPVLRIYASYVDNPLQKERVISKLVNMKNVKEALTRKQDTIENWKAASTKTLENNPGADSNQVTKFGLKLRSRSDDYIPLFEDFYQE